MTIKRLHLLLLLFATLAALPASVSVWAESSMALSEIISMTGARLRWSPYRGEGHILKGDKEVLFREESGFVLVNYAKKVSVAPPTRGKGGDILFSEEDGQYLIDLLGIKPKLSEGLFISTVIIDAGHGGKDPGAVGSFMHEGQAVVIKEKDLVLDVSKGLAGMLRGRYPEKNILLTRSDDTYLTLEERTEIANGVQLKEQEAMIFISIHANASLDRKAEGFEVWYLPPDYRRKLIDPESLDAQAREVAPILNTMLEEEYTVESVLLAKNILGGLEETVGDSMINRGLKEETWFVVRNAKMPSVLVEIGFVTHKREALQMRNGAYLKKITKGIYNGVCDFIEHFENP